MKRSNFNTYEITRGEKSYTVEVQKQHLSPLYNVTVSGDADFGFSSVRFDGPMTLTKARNWLFDELDRQVNQGFEWDMQDAQEQRVLRDLYY